jgi:hypothetical protein
VKNTTNPAGVDLRGHRRIAFKVPVECRAGATTIMGSTENIGLGGVLIRASQTLEWDATVTLSFTLPGCTESLNIRGRIAHIVPGKFMGVEFVDLAPAVRERIEEHIAVAPGSK